MNHYYHEVPGRLRFRNPVLKGKQALCKKIEDSISCFSGIQSVTANAVTGSIIVHFDRNFVSSREIIEFVSEQGYFDRQRAVTSDQYLNRSFEKIGESVGKAIFGAMVEKTFQGSALSLVTVLL